MKKYAWLALLIIGFVVVYFYTRGTGAGAGLAESDGKFPEKIGGSSVSRIPADLARDISVSPPVRKARLADIIADQIARNGISSPVVADLVSISQGACTTYYEKTKTGTKATGWANDYLASACQGFVASQYQGLQDPAPDFLEISIADGQDAMEDAALGYLERPNSVLGALQAGTILVGSGKLPDQASYGLSQDQLIRALAAANASTMCPGQNGCVAAQVLVASTCAETSCPVGVTYESALRRNLSAAELEASIRLSQWLKSIRR